MSDMQFLLLASELRTRAEEVLVRAANTNDREVQEMMRVVAAGYEKLARRAEQRVRETDKAQPPRAGRRAVDRGASFPG